MGVAEWLALLTGLLKFPRELLDLVKFLQDTPEENRQEAAASVRKSIDVFRKTGRHEW